MISKIVIVILRLLFNCAKALLLQFYVIGDLLQRRRSQTDSARPSRRKKTVVTPSRGCIV
jgi:hypothetical protein